MKRGAVRTLSHRVFTPFPGREPEKSVGFLELRMLRNETVLDSE